MGLLAQRKAVQAIAMARASARPKGAAFNAGSGRNAADAVAIGVIRHMGPESRLARVLELAVGRSGRGSAPHDCAGATDARAEAARKRLPPAVEGG